MRACIIIPAYNEARHIADLIKEVKVYAFEIIVVDDGSKDDTSGIAQKAGARVIKNEVNQGKGASLKKGFSDALQGGFDAVIAMDGDGQHLPEEIPHFLEAAQSSSAGIFIGNRMRNSKSMPLERFLTNKFMSWIVSVITGQHIPDSQCGYRLLKRELLEKLVLKTSKYEIESEMLIQAARLGFKIEPVIIRTVYTGTKSQINPLLDTFRFIRFILKTMTRG
jgi:glycosyltransferase involved in cell wall biosynthesis